MSERKRETSGSRKRCQGDDGAALVEFALIAPLFFLLVFGIMEFGWAFFQQLDVRHGAREGARLAAVDYKTTASPTPATQTDQIVAEVCERMDSGDNVTVQITQSGTSAIGQQFEVTIEKPLDQLTGFLGFALDGIDITSHVESRLEQTAGWESMGSAETCP